MQRTKKVSFIIFIAGYCLSLIILLGGLVLLNADQCPLGYTQEQIDETGCIIGANIGLGLAVLASVAVGIITTISAIIILAVPLLVKHFNKH